MKKNHEKRNKIYSSLKHPASIKWGSNVDFRVFAGRSKK
jgi:hypothetical protein